MILIDANLLVYAYDTASPRHEGARTWLEKRLSGPDPVGLAWVPIVAFIRLTTNPKVFVSPLSLEEATAALLSWLHRPNVVLLHPTGRHWEIFRRLLIQGRASGPLATDAHLAALAVERLMG